MNEVIEDLKKKYNLKNVKFMVKTSEGDSEIAESPDFIEGEIENDGK